MSANTGTIKIALQMDDKGSIRVLKTFGRASSKTGRQGKEAFDKMDKSALKFTKNVSGAGTALLKIGAGVAGLLAVRAALNSLADAAKEYVGLANTQEEAETDLAAVLRSTGHAAGFNLSQLKNMAGAMQDVTTVGDEVILSGMSILATFKQVRGQAFERASMAALDMSRIMKQDLKSSMVQVGKALNDPVTGLTALSRAGVTFSDEQKDMIRTLQESGDVMGAQGIILQELESQFGGAAAAASKTFAGGLEQAQNALGDTKEELGFIITKNQFFIELTHLATQQFKLWGEQIKDNRGYLMTLAKNGVLAVVDALGAGIETLRFFHNGWLGIKLAADLALEGIGWLLQEDIRMMRMFLMPLDKIFDGLVEIKTLKVNPFDSLEQGIAVFRASSHDVTQEVMDDIKKNNQAYDAWGNKIAQLRNKIAAIPVSQVEADKKTIKSTSGTLDALTGLQNKYAKSVIENQKRALDSLQNINVDIALDDFFKDVDQAEEGVYKLKKSLVSLKNINIDLALDKAFEDIDAFEAKIRDAGQSTAEAMKEAAIDWSSSLSSQLTDMVWGADASFSDIASSFGKMLTNMMIQKQVAEPLMNWMGGGIESFGSWLFSAHGNAFDKSGVKAYAHGGTFTNKIVDQPTLFAHGGGLGVMGELGKKRPEVIAPLFRASNGDMGV